VRSGYAHLAKTAGRKDRTMSRQVRILTGEPTIEILAEMKLDWWSIRGMAAWVKDRRPECLPDYEPISSRSEWEDKCCGDYAPPEASLFPHYLEREGDFTPEDYEQGKHLLSDNELLVELAGRKCYDSFGEKAGRKTNADYIAHTQQGEIPHASILYHAKMTFFFAGISRRVSQEMMRNYVGSDRDQEGSPSQESTRYTEQTGVFVAHPRICNDEGELEAYRICMQSAYDFYQYYIRRQVEKYQAENGQEPKGMARKRIYEAAIGRLPWDFETSCIWTTNPAALMKLFRERCDSAADLEFQRFAKKLRRICFERCPNLFPKLTKEIVYA
jgi:thymidylate synthase (FAD)